MLVVRFPRHSYYIGGEEKTVTAVVSEVRLKRGESVERALRRLKKKLDREGIMRAMRAHRHYEKPSEKKRRKSARARSRLNSLR